MSNLHANNLHATIQQYPKCFLAKMFCDLCSNGFTEDAALQVLQSMIEEEHDSSMRSRWIDDAGMYPEKMYDILWVGCKRYALKWIDQHAPRAWFRPVFQPAEEQEVFLKQMGADTPSYPTGGN